MEDGIEVLFLTSDPFRDGARERLDEEVAAIQRALAERRGSLPLKLVSGFVASTRDLQHALMALDPRIVHFAGHGEGTIYLGDPEGRRGVVGRESLGKLFGILNEWIKVVILSGCSTPSALEALRGAVDYTIAMDQPLGAPSSVAFAAAFYEALGRGRTVRAAFELAVSQLPAGAATPVLHVRARSRRRPRSRRRVS